MKLLTKIFFAFALIISTNSVFSQGTLEKYIISKGVETLCQAAHPSNDYLSGTYDIMSKHVSVSIKSKDNFFGGAIHTDITVVRGTGDLYFSDIIVDNDDDIVKPFEAFGMQASLLITIINAVDSETYIKIKAAMQANFNTNVEKWTGKMWALLALNLDYYGYILNK